MQDEKISYFFLRCRYNGIPLRCTPSLILGVKPNNIFYKILAEAVCFSNRDPRIILVYKNAWYRPEKHANIILMKLFVLYKLCICLVLIKRFLSYVEGSHTKAFFEEFLQGNAISFDFKWLRGVHNGSFTGMQILFKISKISQKLYIFGPKIFFWKGAHVDNVYMGRGTSNLLTIWTPFGDNPIEMGSLAVVESSHKMPQMKHFQV